MKKILLPAMFIIALAGSAFTRFSKTSVADPTSAYYADNFGNCQVIQLFDSKCIMDDVAYLCYENVHGLGYTVMWQYNLGNTCYDAYYSYYP